MLTMFKTKTPSFRQSGNLQILDLLQLSRKERECKIACLRTIRQFEIWKKKHRSANDSAFSLYSQIEGVILRRQAQDAVLFYKLIRKDRMRAFQHYMEKLSTANPVAGAVS